MLLWSAKHCSGEKVLGRQPKWCSPILGQSEALRPCQEERSFSQLKVEKCPFKSFLLSPALDISNLFARQYILRKKQKKNKKIIKCGQNFPFKTFFPLFLSMSSSFHRLQTGYFYCVPFFFSSPRFPFVSLPLFPPNPLVVHNCRSAAFQPVTIKHSSYKTRAGFTRPPGSSRVTHKQTPTHTLKTDVAAPRSPSPTLDLL